MRHRDGELSAPTSPLPQRCVFFSSKADSVRELIRSRKLQVSSSSLHPPNRAGDHAEEDTLRCGLGCCQGKLEAWEEPLTTAAETPLSPAWERGTALTHPPSRERWQGAVAGSCSACSQAGPCTAAHPAAGPPHGSSSVLPGGTDWGLSRALGTAFPKGCTGSAHSQDKAQGC